jgi:hypothetical protein
MDDRETSESTIRPMRHSTLLMFGIFAAPAAWALQLVASYALAATSCFSGGVATAAPRASAACRSRSSRSRACSTRSRG